MSYVMREHPAHPFATNASMARVTITLPARGQFEMVPAPYYYICIEAKDEATKTDPFATTTRCFKVLIQLAPRWVGECPSVTPATIGMGSVTPKTCALQALQKSTKIGVGQRFKGFIYFEDLNRDGTVGCSMCDGVDLAIMADPGLPNGATLEAGKGGPDDRCGRTTRQVARQPLPLSASSSNPSLRACPVRLDQC